MARFKTSFGRIFGRISAEISDSITYLEQGLEIAKIWQ